jgi:hypothetical protein
MHPVTVVIIEEVKSGDWGVGGKAFPCADCTALAGGRQKILSNPNTLLYQGLYVDLPAWGFYVLAW